MRNALIAAVAAAASGTAATILVTSPANGSVVERYWFSEPRIRFKRRRRATLRAGRRAWRGMRGA